ncbi:MAG: hypothetical protein JWN70_5316 [Planctomycetaceae bacterium]|nr:hypothetical protein [Planctomycetaceae bacterium]
MKRSEKRGSRSPGVKAHLLDAKQHLAEVMGEEFFFDACSLEIQAAIDGALRSIQKALECLDSMPQPVLISPMPLASPPRGKDGPTHQQGQFLAYIREYMKRSYSDIAPTHAELQRFFHLTPPSVNSMLKRLEERGFIRRIPGKARAIEITISPDLIPPLDRPFKNLN